MPILIRLSKKFPFVGLKREDGDENEDEDDEDEEEEKEIAEQGKRDADFMINLMVEDALWRIAGTANKNQDTKDSEKETTPRTLWESLVGVAYSFDGPMQKALGIPDAICSHKDTFHNAVRSICCARAAKLGYRDGASKEDVIKIIGKIHEEREAHGKQ